MTAFSTKGVYFTFTDGIRFAVLPQMRECFHTTASKCWFSSFVLQWLITPDLSNVIQTWSRMIWIHMMINLLSAAEVSASACWAATQGFPELLLLGVEWHPWHDMRIKKKIWSCLSAALRLVHPVSLWPECQFSLHHSLCKHFSDSASIQYVSKTLCYFDSHPLTYRFGQTFCPANTESTFWCLCCE